MSCCNLPSKSEASILLLFKNETRWLNKVMKEENKARIFIETFD